MMYLDRDERCILILKFLHKLIVYFVIRLIHPNNIERMLRYLQDSFIEIIFMLYLDLLFDNVIARYVFVADEGDIHPDFFKFLFHVIKSTRV